jgi:cobalt/nickel transport system permease protein
VTQSSYLEKTIRGLSAALSDSLFSERMARKTGLLQSLDPRVRLAGALLLVVAVVACRRLEVVVCLFVVATVIALLSKVGLGVLIKRVWLAILFFTGIIAIPAMFITPGRSLWTGTSHFTISATGVRAAAMLILRVETAATLTATLVFCTHWTQILKALRILRMPMEIISILTMTHRYIFLLLETAQQMFESRQSRTVGIMLESERRKVVSQTAGVLMSKSIDLSNEVYLAMLSRGFRGEVRLLTDFRFVARDYAALILFFVAAFMAVWIGR